MNKLLKVCGVLFLLVIGGCCVVLAIGGRANQQVHQQWIEQSSNDITLHQFNALYNGMAYADAVRSLGRQGVVQSENMLNDGYGGQLHTVMYSWENSGFASMSAMFQNDSLIQKFQFGLK